MSRIRSKRVMAAVLAVVMMLSMTLTGWPAGMMRVSAAETTPGEPTIDYNNWRIFANGTPIVVKEVGGATLLYKSDDLNTPLFPGDTITYFVIYGGWESADYTGNTSVTIESGQLNWSVFGGNASGTITGDTNITVNGGTLGYLYGGGYEGAVTGNTNVTIKNGTFHGGVYGGGNQAAATVGGNTNIIIEGGIFNWIYGGGYMGAVTYDTNLLIKNGTFREMICGGGYEAAATVSGNANIAIENGTFKWINGGGYSGDITGDVNLLITNGTFTEIVVGGGINGAVTGGVNMTVTGGSFTSLYGGCDLNNVTGDVIINIYPESTISGDIDVDSRNNSTWGYTVGADSKINYYRSVSYEGNSGTGTAPDMSYGLSGDTVNAAPTNTFTAPGGYYFKEWNTKADGKGTAYAPGAEVAIAGENITLYAIWKPIPDTSSWSGLGTQESPYQISNAAQLSKIGSELNRGSSFDNTYFKMTNDIDLDVAPYDTGTGWEPIGTDTNPFTGVFDGGGFVIKNIMINRTSSCIGLFGVIDLDAKIQNLGIDGGSIKGNRVGGIVGWAKSGEIINCYNTAPITTGVITGEVGGIVGYNSYANIKNCYNTGDITAQLGYSLAGGITGSNSGGIDNCFNTGNVSVLVANGVTEAGGIVGLNSGNASITNCYNTGDISASKYVGGIAGVNDGGNAKISNCYSIGGVTRVTGELFYLMGGIAGMNNLPGNEISNCYYDRDKYPSPGVVVGGSSGTVTNVGGYDSWQMLRDGVIDTGGSIQDLLGDAFIKKANDADKSYYPQLEVFANSDNAADKVVSTASVTYIKTNQTGVTFPSAATIAYGSKLSASTLSGGIPAGMFAWTDGTIIPKVSNSGYDVTFTPAYPEIYLTVTQKVNITVSPKALTVNVTVNDKPYDGLNTATIKTAVLVDVLSGDTVTLTNGTPTFASFGVADNIDISFTAFSIGSVDAGNYILTQPSNVKANISKANPAYTLPTPLATYGNTLASVTLPTGWTWEAAGTTPVGNAGNQTHKAKFTPADTDNYNTLTGIDITISVAKANPAYTLPTPSATYGNTLASVTLPTGWTWEAAGTTPVGNAGNQTHKAKFTPGDTDNYNNLTGIDVTISVVRKKIAVPAAKTGLVYNGKTQTGANSGAGYTIKGNIGKNAKTYTATVTPDSNHQWKSGANPTKARAVKFTIAKKALAKPTKLKITTKKASWKKVSNNNGYTLKVMQGKKTVFTVQVKKNKTSHTFTKTQLKKLKKGKKYHFTLKAKGKGNYKNSKTVKSKKVTIR